MLAKLRGDILGMRQLNVPFAMPDGGKVLHIGLPKTGTTALQTALHRSRPVLAEQGVFNASPGRHPYPAARFAAGNALPFRVEQAEEGWRRVARRFRESTARATIFSSEALFAANQERAQAIAEELGGAPYIVVTLRALAAQLRAQWQQSFVSNGHRTFDEWMTKRLNNQERLNWIAPQRILDAWGPVVGEDKIIFMIASPDRTAIFRRFEALLGMTPESLEMPHLDNAALSASGSEFLRQINVIETAKRDDPNSVRAEVLRRGTWRIQHTPGVGREPVRVPRWAAARANEIAHEWMSQLEDSSAAVVGAIDDLVVDLDGLPEQVTTPTQIDVGDAARFALAFCEAAVRYVEKPPGEAAVRAEDLPLRDLLAIVRARVARRLSGRRTTRD
jgi:hypothetical protein